MEELDVEEYCQTLKSPFGSWSLSQKQDARLMLLDSERLQRVRKLVSLDCSEDPIWAQQLLEQLAPQLEEVQIWNVQKRHLICLESMPKLHRLQVEGWDERLQIEPFIFKPLDSHSVGLQFLHVFLPKETSLSLIAAHGQTLKELELCVCLSKRSHHSRQWMCRDLGSRLYLCGLQNLAGLVLRRGDETDIHPKARCKTQVKCLRTKLPWVNVFCDKCEKIPW